MRPLDESVRYLAGTQNGIVTARQLAPLGIDRHRLRDDVLAGRVVRLYPGVFAVADGAEHVRVRLAAALAYLGPDATLVVGSAGIVHGIWGLSPERTPEIALPPGLEKRQRAGLEIRFWDIPPDHRTVVDGLAVTTAARTVSDLARELPRAAAVGCVDSALNLGLVEVDDLGSVVEMMQRKRNCVAGRRHIASARIGAQSPLETTTRLICDDAGFAPDALQVPINDRDGRLLGYGDLGWRLRSGTWLIAEVDGACVHDTPEALFRDRHRQNAFLSAAGAQIVRFTAADLRRPAYVVGVIAPLLKAGGWQRAA